MKYDVVYPVKDDPTAWYEELRYSLRSLHNVKNINKVYVVCHPKPMWLNDKAIWVDQPDVFPELKQSNVINKILTACNHVKGDFFVLNDDFLFLQPMMLNPVYEYRGSLGFLLEEKQEKSDNGKYVRAIRNTITWLEALGVFQINHEQHTPIMFNSDKFKTLFLDKGVEWRNYNYVYRSLYCNYYDVVMKQAEKDYKIYDTDTFIDALIPVPPKSLTMVSTSPSIERQTLFKKWREDTFNRTSKYEE